MEGAVNRSREATVLLACVAVALLMLAALTVNIARLGSAISREVGQAQVAYMQTMGSGEPVQNNALVLGHCLRKEMLKSARAGFVHPDTWALSARLRALPVCTQLLPPIPPAQPPVITAPRIRAIVTSAPGTAIRSRRPAVGSHGD